MPEPSELAMEIASMRDENDSLRAECQELKFAFNAKTEEHDNFITEITELMPPSYDADEAVEAVILKFMKDISEVGRVIAKLTADYRLS